MADPIVAPVEIIGDSRPTDPPNPAVKDPPISDENILWFLMLPSNFEITYSIRGTPCPTLSFTIYLRKIIVRRIPMIGNPISGSIVSESE